MYLVLWVFYLVPSSARYFSVVLFCLTYCVCGFLCTSYRVVVTLASDVYPLLGEIGTLTCVGFLFVCVC